MMCHEEQKDDEERESKHGKSLLAFSVGLVPTISIAQFIQVDNINTPRYQFPFTLSSALSTLSSPHPRTHPPGWLVLAHYIHSTLLQSNPRAAEYSSLAFYNTFFQNFTPLQDSLSSFIMALAHSSDIVCNS